ncbi:MAG: DNA-binding protein [Euryarchaeota archaeon]|nr:DNA-binding protein [Euryarchaeota archaeon]
MNVDDKELEEIRKRKLLELQKRLQEAQIDQKIEEAREAQEEVLRRTILSRILTTEAKDRLARVKLVRPEIARLVEDYLISLYQSGRIRGKVTDETLKKLLAQLHERTKKDFRIKM